MGEEKLIHSQLTRQIIGAAMEVHSQLGSGFLESVYEEALSYELTIEGLLYERQKPIVVMYKGHSVGTYICDYLVDGKVLVELKAIQRLTSSDEAQLLNYLKATGIRIGLLFNFGAENLEYKRRVL
jgi:GxxExxY protein